MFVRRLAAAIVAASAPLAAAAVAPSAVSSAACGDTNLAVNAWSSACQLPPAPPAWYVVRPAYAPPNAPLDVPPPPPPPPGGEHLLPRWDENGQHWIWVGN